MYAMMPMRKGVSGRRGGQSVRALGVGVRGAFSVHPPGMLLTGGPSGGRMFWFEPVQHYDTHSTVLRKDWTSLL